MLSTSLLWILSIKQASIAREIGEALSFQAPHSFIHHRPSIYTCSQNSVYKSEIYWGHEVIIYVTLCLLDHRSFCSIFISDSLFLKSLDVCVPTGSPLWGDLPHCLHSARLSFGRSPSFPLTLEKEPGRTRRQKANQVRRFISVTNTQ